jgi:hypothetical protein
MAAPWSTSSRQQKSVLVVVVLVLLLGSVRVFWIPNHLIVLLDGVNGESSSVNKSRDSILVAPCPNHRHCSSYENVIWYHSKQHDMAGLDDRRQILNSFGNLAGSLCARLAVSPPKHLLDAERHNTLVAPTLRWTDLMNLTYIHDKSPAGVLWELPDAQQQLYTQEFDDHTRIITRQPKDLLPDFIQFWNKNGSELFVWDVRVSWHAAKGLWNKSQITRMMEESSSSSSSFGPPSPLDAFPAIFTDSTLSPQQGCTYSRGGIPAPMQGLADEIWQDILLLATPTTTSVSTSIGFLHIRRGDSISRCNTTLPKLQRYLACSLHGLPPTVILLASDETDPVYRASIQSLLKIVGGHAMIDLDALVWDRIQHLKNHALHNNYYVYGIESLLKTAYVDFVLQQRQRHDCLDCQDVQAMLG